jgi:hypothetical protein
MGVCAKAIQQPDGTLLLALDPAITDTSTCAYVVETGASNAWTELGNMSMENAQEISAYVCLLWAIAWGMRAIRNAIFLDEGTKDE